MNMQSNGEGNSLYPALSAFVYSDFTNQHLHNHVMERSSLPPPLGEEFWSSQFGGKNPFESFTSPQIPRASHFPFESPKSVMHSTFEAYEGVPFDPTTRWGFNRAASDQELQESSIMNEWILSEEERLRLESMNPGPSRFSKELCLSLATSSHPRVVVNEVSELSSSGSLRRRHVGSDNTSCSSNNLSLNFNSYSSGSRFFQAMQEILAEFACYALESYDHDQHRASLASARAEELESEHRFLIQNNGKELESKKKHLLSLLQVVDEQYNQCVDEIHTVISAFHAVTELDPNLHSRFALPTISFMYRNLRERISSHILAMGARQSEEKETREESSLETSFVQKQWALQQIKKRENQLWRPQRGLPERSVSVLRAWMFQNFLHPYPKDAEKHLLALKSGLTRSQVSNWFINARVRLWKPMIEEMYAEMNRRKASKNQEDGNGNGSHRSHLLFGNRKFTVD